MIKIHKIIEQTRVEGPGTRFCVWVQGCHNGCKGCFAANTWDEKEGTWFKEEEIISEIELLKAKIEGVTFLGGEPFEQAEGLAIVAEAVHNMGLSVLTFTGKIYEELSACKDPNILKLLAYTDLLIDGPYQEKLRDFSRPLVGSENQRYLFLSTRYCQEDIDVLHNEFEIRVDRNGVIQINGMGNLTQLEIYLKKIKGEMNE